MIDDVHIHDNISIINDDINDDINDAINDDINDDDINSLELTKHIQKQHSNNILFRHVPIRKIFTPLSTLSYHNHNHSHHNSSINDDDKQDDRLFMIADDLSDTSSEDHHLHIDLYNRTRSNDDDKKDKVHRKLILTKHKQSPKRVKRSRDDVIANDIKDIKDNEDNEDDLVDTNDDNDDEDDKDDNNDSDDDDIWLSTTRRTSSTLLNKKKVIASSRRTRSSPSHSISNTTSNTNANGNVNSNVNSNVNGYSCADLGGRRSSRIASPSPNAPNASNTSNASNGSSNASSNGIGGRRSLRSSHNTSLDNADNIHDNTIAGDDVYDDIASPLGDIPMLTNTRQSFKQQSPPQQTQQQQHQELMWECELCTLQNPLEKLTCLACNSAKPRPTTTLSDAALEKENVWCCDQCTLENAIDVKSCAACGYKQPKLEKVGGKRPSPSPDIKAIGSTNISKRDVPTKIQSTTRSSNASSSSSGLVNSTALLQRLRQKQSLLPSIPDNDLASNQLELMAFEKVSMQAVLSDSTNITNDYRGDGAMVPTHLNSDPVDDENDFNSIMPRKIQRLLSGSSQPSKVSSKSTTRSSRSKKLQMESSDDEENDNLDGFIVKEDDQDAWAEYESDALENSSEADEDDTNDSDYVAKFNPKNFRATPSTTRSREQASSSSKQVSSTQSNKPTASKVACAVDLTESDFEGRVETLSTNKRKSSFLGGGSGDIWEDPVDDDSNDNDEFLFRNYGKGTKRQRAFANATPISRGSNSNLNTPQRPSPGRDDEIEDIDDENDDDFDFLSRPKIVIPPTYPRFSQHYWSCQDLQTKRAETLLTRSAFKLKELNETGFDAFYESRRIKREAKADQDKTDQGNKTARRTSKSGSRKSFGSRPRVFGRNR